MVSSVCVARQLDLGEFQRLLHADDIPSFGRCEGLDKRFRVLVVEFEVEIHDADFACQRWPYVEQPRDDLSALISMVANVATPVSMP